jgi:ribonuclease P protein component
MTAPDASGDDASRASGRPPQWERLKRRAEFQRVSRGRRARAEAFTLQSNRRAETAAAAGPRVGFTVSKQVGDAVERNRVRRRLKEALRRAESVAPAPDHDYVLLARREALARPFAALVADIERAFAQLSRPERPARAAAATDREKRS